jgi:hypothetical protein
MIQKGEGSHRRRERLPFSPSPFLPRSETQRQGEGQRCRTLLPLVPGRAKRRAAFQNAVREKGPTTWSFFLVICVFSRHTAGLFPSPFLCLSGLLWTGVAWPPLCTPLHDVIYFHLSFSFRCGGWRFTLRPLFVWNSLCGCLLTCTKRKLKNPPDE